MARRVWQGAEKVLEGLPAGRPTEVLKGLTAMQEEHKSLLFSRSFGWGANRNFAVFHYLLAHHRVVAKPALQAQGKQVIPHRGRRLKVQPGNDPLLKNRQLHQPYWTVKGKPTGRQPVPVRKLLCCFSPYQFLHFLFPIIIQINSKFNKYTFTV
jgi:hypothetical protein